ncbi:Lactonase, 7-bladed beta-propeller-domain-containing protein [Crucibulum laeve]|uniref:Lactonase, 7-bladed beta-propeller-domain-containing protein n=1 Tax=Crucibulum laeve TaxID=68775 RepID=A0A5C3MUQ5_9AGAR|nr:Lactonase, 7-bladed beta-propeller-domain-containing protein [Crucibulum laeve]
MTHRILVSSYTNDITTLSFDTSAPSLTVTSITTVGYHPSWITFHPGDRSLVCAGLEQSDGKVILLKYDEVGKGTIVAEAPSGGRDPCSLLATKEELLIANYSSGIVASLPLSSKPPYLLDTTPRKITLSGTGPNKQRQEGSHPHQVIIQEDYQELLVPDLGADRVCRFKKVQDGSWELRGHIQYELGGGPRHVGFYDGHLFTLLELSSKLTRHRFPPLPKLPTFVTSTPTMSNPPPSPNDMLAAEILIPRPNSTFNTPYLYLSNRNDPSPEGDIISIFAISNPETLELVAEVRTGLKHLRGMVFGGEDDKYLVAGGVNGGGVKIFQRVDGGKGLKEVAANTSVEAPTGFLWA